MLLKLTCPYCERRIIAYWSDFVFPGSPYVCRCNKTSILAVALRPPTPEEQREIDTDPTTAAIRAARLAAVKAPPARHGRPALEVARRPDE
jgi:hypothetical protein